MKASSVYFPMPLCLLHVAWLCLASFGWRWVEWILSGLERCMLPFVGFTLFHQALGWSSCLRSNFRHASGSVFHRTTFLWLNLRTVFIGLPSEVDGADHLYRCTSRHRYTPNDCTLSATFWYGALTSTWAPEWSPLSLTHSTREINLFALIRCCFQFVPGQSFECFCILFGTSEPACWPPLTEGGPTETFVAPKQHPAKKRSKKTSTSDNFVL